MTEKIEIQWRSLNERFDCFNALLILAKRGLISLDIYHKTMEIIMERPVWSHELGTTGIENMRCELEGRSSKDPLEVLIDIRKSAKRRKW